LRELAMDEQVPTTPKKFTLQDVFSIEAAWGLWSYYVSRLVAVVVLAAVVLRLAGVECCRLDFGTAETRARAEARRARLEEEDEEEEEYASRGVELTTLDEEADEGSDHDDALLMMAANTEGRGCREWGEAGRAGSSGAGAEEAGDEGGRRKRDA